MVPPKDGRGHGHLGLGLTPSPSMPNLKLDYGTGTGTGTMGTTTIGRGAARGGNANANTNTLFLTDNNPNTGHHPHDLSTRLKSSSMIQPPGKNGKLNREIVVFLDDDGNGKGKGKGKEAEGGGIGHALRMRWVLDFFISYFFYFIPLFSFLLRLPRILESSCIM
jgi:hypothetical protein